MSASPQTSRRSGYAARPDYRVDLLRRPNAVQARAGGRVVAASARAVFVDEQDHALVAYFPREDVDTAALVAIADRSTHCPYKGDARYWALAAAPDEPIAWSYPAPFPEVATLADHIAFQQDRVEVIIGARAKP